MKITKKITNLSLVVQWDTMEDFTDTTYTVVLWHSETNYIHKIAAVTEQKSYTITGLTLDTVYTITVSTGNKCGNGPEYTTNILLAAGNISTYSYCY